MKTLSAKKVFHSRSFCEFFSAANKSVLFNQWTKWR